MSLNNNYNSGVIDVSIGSERYRDNVGMHLGADDYVGVENQLFEYIDNAVDEDVQYYDNISTTARNKGLNKLPSPRRIYLTIYQDWSVKLKDTGRGLPIGHHPVVKDMRGCYLIYENDSAGAKGAHNVNGDAYSKLGGASGMHGAGACVSTACTSRMLVTVGSSGEYDEVTKENLPPGIYQFGYTDGNRSMDLQRVGDIEEDYDECARELGYKGTFTQIEYKFEESVFEKGYGGNLSALPYNKFAIIERLKFSLMSLYLLDNDPIEIHFKWLDEPEVVFKPSMYSVIDYLGVKNTKDALAIDIKSNTDNVKNQFFGRIFLCRDVINTSFSSKTVVNRLNLTSALYNDLIKESLTGLYAYKLDEMLRQARPNTQVTNNKISNEVDNLVRKHKCLNILTMPRPSFTGQTKKDLASKGFKSDFSNQISNIFANCLESYFMQYIKPAVDSLVKFSDQLDANEIQREKDEKHQMVLEKNNDFIAEAKNSAKDPDAHLRLKNKLVDKVNRFQVEQNILPPEECYLIIAEGPSAINGLGKCKDLPVYIFALTGKPKNASNSDEEITFEQLKMLIMYLLLPFKGVYILSDADSDGYHIRVLLLEIIMKFAKNYFINESVYIVNSPSARLINSTNAPIVINGGTPTEYTVNVGETVYSINPLETETWTSMGLNLVTKYGGLSDSMTDNNNISIKDLISNPRYISKITYPTVTDCNMLDDILSKKSYLKKELSNSICTKELKFIRNISNRPEDIKPKSIKMENTLFELEPTVVDWKRYEINSGGALW